MFALHVERRRGVLSVWRRRTVRGVLALLLLAAWDRSADAYDGAFAGSGASEKRSRGTWAALLVGYVALGALTTAGAYYLRDNFAGRTVAVTAAGWGGLVTGAGAGYGLMHLRGCRSADCGDEQQVATAVGALLGTVAATIAGHLLTSDPGMSRPYTAVAGLTPALIFLSVGTVTDW